jgi:acyl phosphate:glycerol-3-phosphate acyltransferase
VKHIGRKAYHLIGGIGLLSVYYVLGRERALVFYGALFIIVLILDGARLMIPWLNGYIFSRFRSFIRPNEEHKLTGTAPYVLGIGFSLYAYAQPVATAAICFLAFGDVAATAIGERFGKTKIGDKSLEGTGAFIVAASLSGILLSLMGIHLPAWVMVLGVVVAAGVELLTLPVNDNLVIPIVSGGIMELALKISG